MSWFSDAFDFCCDVVSSVVDTVVNVASAVVETVVEVAGKAVRWIADNAEKTWETVKKVWEFTKKVIKPVLIIAYHLIPFPVLKAAVKVMIVAIQILERVLDLPIAKQIGKAIQWCIDIAKKIKSVNLNEIERREAYERRKLLNQATDSLDSHDREQRSVVIAKVINEFVILQSEIDDYLKDTVTITDYDHFLRLRAAHKLLDLTEKKLEKQEIDMFEFTDDDLFVLEIGNKLISESPKISNDDLTKLDRIIWEVSGKKLLPFVFEELLLAWTNGAEEKESEWVKLNKLQSQKKVELRSAEIKLKYGETIQIDLSELKKSIESMTGELESLVHNINERWMLIDASEGFLQILERNDNIMDKPYLLNEGEKVGQLIIECQEYGKSLEQMNEEDQALILDFANIFRKDRENRLKNIPTIQVEVGA